MRASLKMMSVLIWLVSAPFTMASPEADNLVKVLRLNEIIDVMRDEGIQFSQDLNDDMLGGTGGQFWTESISRLYDTKRMVTVLRMALAKAMKPEQIAATTAYFETEQGQRILTLETSARAAMFSPDVEDFARANYQDIADSDDLRLAVVTRFIAANDLLEMNVAGAMTANYQFYRGLVDGGSMTLSEDEMLADVWDQEGEIRDDTKSWLYGFLLMAYRPLSDAELEAYLEFSASDAGKSLNLALFAGFDEMYNSISYELGRTVARAMKSSDL